MRLLQNLSHRVFPLLALLVLAASGASAQQVFLNEVDADSYTVPDSLEFVELFGAPDQPLDGHIVVFYKGGGSVLTSTAYAAFDLDGFQTDSAGFFLLANPQVGGADIEFEPGLLRARSVAECQHRSQHGRGLARAE